jgi:RNA polymerase sigma factor (sigma-70 family)
MGVRDDQLVSSALAGDPAAFALLVERNRTRVEAVVARMVGQEAEDLVQEALLRAYLGLPRLRDPARFGAWLCGIAVNLAKMRLRRRALEARHVAEPSSGGGLEERELLRLVRDAVAVLPVGQREAVLMHYIDGLSCDEIAALLGSSPGAIRVRLHRARRQLQAQLAPFAPTPTPKEEIQMIEMRIKDVYVRVAEDDPMKLVSDKRVVLLKESKGERLLPIWIGAAEGNSLALRLTDEGTPRPVTSDVMAELIRVTGARVERIDVTDLRDKTFYAAIVVGVDGRTDEVDARPSDALNLAARVGAPIFVDDGVLERCAMPGGDITTQLQAEGEKADQQPEPGVWRSLSAELLRSLYSWR